MKAEHHNKVYHITSNSYCLQSMSQRIPYFSIKQRWNKWKTCIHRSNWVSIAAKIAFRSCWLKVISTNQLHGLATRNDMMSFTLAHDDSHSSSGLQNWEQEKRNKNSQIAKRKRFRSLDSGPHSHDDFGRRPSLCHGWCKEIHWQVHCGSEAWAEGHIKMYLKKTSKIQWIFPKNPSPQSWRSSHPNEYSFQYAHLWQLRSNRRPHWINGNGDAMRNRGTGCKRGTCPKYTTDRRS